MMLVVAAIVINWVVISWTHLKFRKFMQRQVKRLNSQASCIHLATIFVWHSCLEF